MAVRLDVRNEKAESVATLWPVAPQEDVPGWLSMKLNFISLNEAETLELYTQLGNALAIMRGDVRSAA